jgi:predicted ribosome quality control (RQC) complex YloA/Tae2 family protein
LCKLLKQYQRRLKKRAKKLRAEAAEKAKHLNDNRIGDLLKGEIHKIKRGTRKVAVTDYYSSDLEKVEITLNPALSPLANLEKLYKNAKKAKRGIKLIEERLKTTAQEEDYAAELLFQLEQLSKNPDREISDEEQELLELAAKLTEKKWHRTPTPAKTGKAKLKEKTIAKSGNRKITDKKQRGVEKIAGISGGIIYLGRNVIGNENIYRHLGAPDDLWFHAHNCPGAHVLLKTAPGAVECEKEQMQAAALAAANSKFQAEKVIAVTMTRIKYLRKPKGGRLGQLLLSGPINTIQVNNHD